MKKGHKHLVWLLSGLGAIGMAVGIWAGVFKKAGASASATWQVEPVIQRTIGSEVRATGIIKPRIGAEVRVGSRVSGIVKRLYTRIGDTVKKGTLLAELDASELQARYDQAAASFAMAQANLEYNGLDLERKRRLAEQRCISRNELDMAEKTYRVTFAQMKEARASLEYARVQLGYTRIFSPISGVVASVSTQEGETIVASFAAPTFMTIIDLDRLEIWAYVDETDIGRIKTGQQGLFTVDTYADTSFHGQVAAIYPKAEMQNNVVNYITVMGISGNQGAVLRPEMTTTVTIFMERRTNVLTVPRQAVLGEQGSRYVQILQNGRPVRRPVKTGMNDENFTEILEGLQAGEKVIAGEIPANR
jgi:macrolide-specific efflux system membrane fusion protein